jgi:WD40 repeat protein
VTEDDRFLLWARGPNQISLVDTETFSARHIHNFWNFKQGTSNIIAVAIDCSAKKVVGIGETTLPFE